MSKASRVDGFLNPNLDLFFSINGSGTISVSLKLSVPKSKAHPRPMTVGSSSMTVATGTPVLSRASVAASRRFSSGVMTGSSEGRRLKVRSSGVGIGRVVSISH